MPGCKKHLKCYFPLRTNALRFPLNLLFVTKPKGLPFSSYPIIIITIKQYYHHCTLKQAFIQTQLHGNPFLRTIMHDFSIFIFVFIYFEHRCFSLDLWPNWQLRAQEDFFMMLKQPWVSMNIYLEYRIYRNKYKKQIYIIHIKRKSLINHEYLLRFLVLEQVWEIYDGLGTRWWLH